MQLLNGKMTAAAICMELKAEVDELVGRVGRRPGLAMILVGADQASQIYMHNKVRACEEMGIISENLFLEVGVAPEVLNSIIDELNRRSEVDGILLQLPLPNRFNQFDLLCRIAPEKDVDGFHPFNIGRLVIGLSGFWPCTPAGVMELLRRYEFRVRGKRVVVLGRSNIVGKPLAALLTVADATVTICHSRTLDVAAECRQADFVFAAIGIPRFVTADMVAEGAIVVDVGINHTASGLVGDCDFEALKGKVAAMTPVPGGVGPMTVAMLLYNTIKAYKMHNSLLY
ncbi:Methylenetetrahydrofolate dehydrogenase / Methenyltetrahydrofolate cyclohydrolase [Desulfovibrionales bacterium]